MLPFRIINVVIACVMILMITSESYIPDVKFEVIKPRGFRAYILDSGGVTSFIININVNSPMIGKQTGMLVGEAKTTIHGHLAVEFDRRVILNEELNYWACVTVNGTEFTRLNLSYTVTKRLDSYRATCVTQANCTVVSLFDDFTDTTIDSETWIVEHRIPTYTGPRYVFNSYLNTPETVSIVYDVLHLKPIALTRDSDVRGTLNLSSSCTSNIADECNLTQQSTFLLPPVKSAMLRSRRTFRYGKFEIRAMLPTGNWIFPIIQLTRPSTDGETVDELWIAYSRGNDIYLNNDFHNPLVSTLLYVGPVESAHEPQRSSKLITYKSDSPLTFSYHVYKLHWYPDKLQFFIDDELIGERNSQLGSFGGPKNIIDYTSMNSMNYQLQIGVGVRGLIDFPDGYANKPWINTERNYLKKFFDDRTNWLHTWNEHDTVLKVDYVKVTDL